MHFEGIVFGAFGAHKLKKTIPDPERLKNWDTAAHYQLLNSLVATLLIFQASILIN